MIVAETRTSNSACENVADFLFRFHFCCIFETTMPTPSTQVRLCHHTFHSNRVYWSRRGSFFFRAPTPRTGVAVKSGAILCSVGLTLPLGWRSFLRNLENPCSQRMHSESQCLPLFSSAAHCVSDKKMNRNT